MANIPDDLKYTEEHEYVRTKGDGIVEVGITDYAQGELGDVVYVELPAAGTKLARHDVFGTIEAVKAVSELFSPVNGEITEVNGNLKDHPESVNSHPHETWMIRMKLTEPAGADSLLDSSQYQALLT